MLNSTTGGQMLVFLAFVFFSILISVGFHLTTLFRVKKHQKVLSICVEAIYSVFSLAFLWYMNFVFNDGQFRFFLLLAIALGAFLYVKICKSALDSTLKSLYNRLNKIKKPTIEAEKK